MVYKINVPLVGGGTRKKEIIDANNNLTVDEIRAGNIAETYKFQGSTSGYTSGGRNADYVNVIDKFPFSSDANATDVGDLLAATTNGSGQSSSSNGYVSGGFAPSRVNVIQKFPFSVDANATDVGDLLAANNDAAGQSSEASGYNSGGQDPTTNVIQKFSFSSDANATDVGDLTLARHRLAGQSSSENGYASGGYIPPATPQLQNDGQENRSRTGAS